MASEKGGLVLDGYQQQQSWRPPPMVGVEVPLPPPSCPSQAPLPPPQTPPQGSVHRRTVAVSVSPSRKSLFEAYLLAVTLGFLGAHHFYLRRTWFGVAYFLTLGLFGVGYVVDLFRVPCLVRDANRALTDPSLQNVKTKCDAYLLWFPCGILGLHYIYLRRPAFGALYFFTLGLCGIGWLVDGIRMPWLVEAANKQGAPYVRQEKGQCMAHILGVSPLGVLGMHHYYLGRPIWGLLYTSTLGLMGVGWVCDWFRIWKLTKRANEIATGSRAAGRKYVDDAYILWFPFGLVGLHHFYLGRHGWGCLYFFTLGLLGLGWLLDSCRLWALVRDYNTALDETLRLLQSRAQAVSEETGGVGAPQTVVHITSVTPGGYPGWGFQYPPPAYTPQQTPYTPQQTPYTPQQTPNPYSVTFDQQQQPPNYGAVGGTALPGGFAPRGSSPPPNYESAAHPEKPGHTQP